MEWTADVSTGEWIRERLDGDPTASMHSFVPRGFPAYVRIFHPATRDRPVGVPWPPLPYERHRDQWHAFQTSRPQIDVESVGWAPTAAAFGRAMHPLAQWHRITASDAAPGERADELRDAAGWRYQDPPIGHLAPELVAQLAGILARHTGTPDDGFVAVWEGHGGLVGAMGYGPSRALLTMTDDPAPSEATTRHGDFLAHAARDRFNDVFRKPTWQPGILPDDVSRGPRLSLPAREHVLFRGGVSELADPSWVRRVPWRDPQLDGDDVPWAAESPSIIWPADRAWVAVTEVDFDSTIVGGGSDLIRSIVTDDILEASPIPEGAKLTDDSDTVNR